MEGSGTKNQYSGSQITPINLVILLKKMLSYKALLLISLLLGVGFSLIWGFFIYQPSYDISVSYSYVLSTDLTISNTYGIKYLDLDNFITKINHTNTVSEFLDETGLKESGISVDSFLKPIKVKRDNNKLLIQISKIKEKNFADYKSYVSYCIDAFNDEVRNNTVTQLQYAKSIILEELQELQDKKFDNDNLNSSTFSHMITLNDRIKMIDVEIAAGEIGAIRLYSDYEEVKVSSRTKNMILIVFTCLFIGVISDFFICYFDPRVYFSEDITDIPQLSNFLISCIPLYGDSGISRKEYLNIASKLPNDISAVSISEISAHAGGREFADGLKNVSSMEVRYVGSLIADASTISNFDKYNVNLIVVRAGINTINQVKNIVRDCRIKNIDNFYFILYGLELSDKAVMQFEDSSVYIKYSFLSFRTWRQHYSKYYKLTNR